MAKSDGMVLSRGLKAHRSRPLSDKSSALACTHLLRTWQRALKEPYLGFDSIDWPYVPPPFYCNDKQ